MTELCKSYFPSELKQAQEELQELKVGRPSMSRGGTHDKDEEDEEDEEEEEEEEEEEVEEAEEEEEGEAEEKKH